MPRTFLKIAPMVPDSHGIEGEYTWYHSGLLPLNGSYQSFTQPGDGVALATDASPGRTIYTWKKDYGSWVNYYATNTNIYEVGVGSRLSGLSTSAYGPKFAGFGPTLYVTNGVTGAANAIHKTTGGAFSAVTTQTDSTGASSADIRPKFLIAFKNQLVAANIVLDANFATGTTQALAAGTYKHLVWWSCPENAEAFGSELGTPAFFNTGFQPIFDESIEITGLAAGEDAFFVFKEHGIYRFNGPPLGGYETISNSIGCIEPNSIQRIGNEIVFLSQAGICSIHVSSNEITNYSAGVNRRSLSNRYYELNGPVGLMPPDDVGISYARISYVQGDTASSAQSPQYGLYFLYYHGAANASQPRILALNLESKEFAFANLNGLVFHSSVIGWESQSTSTFSFPIGNVLISSYSPVASEHLKHRFEPTLQSVSGTLQDNERAVNIRWPFLFASPEKRVSIRSVRPVFDDSEGTGLISDYVISAKVLSLSSSGTNWEEAIETPSTGIANDFNIVFENCPFADRHSIGISILPVDECLIHNVLGLEVEYEEDVLRGK